MLNKKLINKPVYIPEYVYTTSDYKDRIVNPESINIITHNNRFHADEVVGSALLKIFLGIYQDLPANVIRLPHANEVNELIKPMCELGINHYSFILDTGRYYDGKTYFDHHQEAVEDMIEPKATAGRVLDYIIKWEEENVPTASLRMFKYNELKTLCKIVDENDLGITIAKPHSIPALIANLQELEFDIVLNIVVTYIKSIIKSKAGKAELVDNILNHTRYITGTKFRMQYSDSIDEDINLDSWNRIVNQNDFEIPIHGVLAYHKDSKKWKIHTMALKENSYDKSGPALPVDKDVAFVHPAGFIAVDECKETLVNYLLKHFANI
jgi:uncharacterized UPF0160 family protein